MVLGTVALRQVEILHSHGVMALPHGGSLRRSWLDRIPIEIVGKNLVCTGDGIARLGESAATPIQPGRLLPITSAHPVRSRLSPADELVQRFAFASHLH